MKLDQFYDISINTESQIENTIENGIHFRKTKPNPQPDSA